MPSNMFGSNLMNNNASNFQNLQNQYSYPYNYPISRYPWDNSARNVLPGRSVANQDEVVAGEIPMDGSVAIFPKSDGSVIYVKSMNGNGTIDTKFYIPAPEGYSEDVPSEEKKVISNEDILNTITNLANQVDTLQTTVNALTKNNGNRNKQNNKQNQTQKDDVNG